MKQGSRGRHNQLSHRIGGSSGPSSSRPSGGDLGSALGLAAEHGVKELDPAVTALASSDLEDPPRAHRPEHPRAHLEDDFFARGDEISVPPSLVDVEEPEVATR